MVSLKSKHGALKIFYTILSNFKNHKPITNETKHRKNRSLNNVNQFYNKYFDTCKKSYDSENLNERDGKFSHPNQFKIPLEELTRDIYNNEDNNDFKTVINERTYDLKNANKFWMEVTKWMEVRCSE